MGVRLPRASVFIGRRPCFLDKDIPQFLPHLFSPLGAGAVGLGDAGYGGWAGNGGCRSRLIRHPDTDEWCARSTCWTCWRSAQTASSSLGERDCSHARPPHSLRGVALLEEAPCTMPCGPIAPSLFAPARAMPSRKSLARSSSRSWTARLIRSTQASATRR